MRPRKRREPAPEATTEEAPEPESEDEEESSPWRPTFAQTIAVIALVPAFVGLAYTLWPSSPDVAKGTISNLRVREPVTFERYLQLQQLPVPKGMPHAYLARRGAMATFDYELVGLSGEHLQLTWALSDAATNDLVASEPSAFRLTPSNNDDAGAWAVWAPDPKRSGRYYLTVTIFKPQGPPYELTHADTDPFAPAAG
jgi:hypothetical protein